MFKHFLKTLVIFTAMILVGLAGVFLVGYLGGDDLKSMVNDSSQPVAK